MTQTRNSYSREDKINACVRVARQEITAHKVAKQMGAAPGSVYAWRNLYKAEIAAALAAHEDPNTARASAERHTNGGGYATAAATATNGASHVGDYPAAANGTSGSSNNRQSERQLQFGAASGQPPSVRIRELEDEVRQLKQQVTNLKLALADMVLDDHERRRDLPATGGQQHQRSAH